MYPRLYSSTEVRNGDLGNCGPEQRFTHSQHASWGSRWHRWQERPQFPRNPSGGSPSSGDWSWNWGSNQSSQQPTMTRVSKESNWSVWTGRGLRVKDENTKNAVSCPSWWWDIAIFWHSGWNDQHLLPYIFQSLWEFLGDLVRSLGEDATPNDVLQTLDKHYGIVMTFNALSKELYSLKQGSGENVAKFGFHLS